MSVVQFLPDMHLGGVERGVVELSRTLVEQGIKSVVLARHGELAEQIKDEGGIFIPFDCGGKNFLSFPLRGRQLRKKLQSINPPPKIVHVRSRVPAWLLRFSGKKNFNVVSTFHGFYRSPFYSRQMADIADRVICPSQSMVEYCQHQYKVSPHKIRLIPRGVDFSYFNLHAVCPDKIKQLREQYTLGERKIIALVGRMSRLKGHSLFLRAFAKVCQHNSNPPIALIVGSGTPRIKTELNQLVAQLQISEHVRFIGINRQMRDIYALTDLLVSASTHPEAFGRTVAEALAMATPVVAPSHGGALDIVRNGKNGILFHPGDEEDCARAIQTALTSSFLNLPQSVQDFSLEKMSTQTIAVYRELCDNL